METQEQAKQSELTEISLSVDDPGEGIAKPIDKKVSSKSNSLQRFLKMSTKRVNDVFANPSGADEAEIKGPTEGTESNKTESPKRFHLRVGAYRKHPTTSSSMKESKTKNPKEKEEENSEETPSVSSGSSGRSGFRGSVSNYWNLVFKRTQSIGKTNKDNLPSSVTSDEDKVNDGQSNEEVHHLPISDDTDDPSKF